MRLYSYRTRYKEKSADEIRKIIEDKIDQILDLAKVLSEREAQEMEEARRSKIRLIKGGRRRIDPGKP